MSLHDPFPISMKAPDFIYHRASSVAEAIQLLSEYDGNARILSGGQSLIPMLNMRLWRPSALIDINRIPGLDEINSLGKEPKLGTRVRYNTIEKDRKSTRLNSSH